MFRHIRFYLINTLALSYLLTVASVVGEPLSINRVSGEMVIDGEFDEAAWQSASRLTLDYITLPEENTPSNVVTEVRYFENGDTIYIAFNAFDPEPSSIRGFFHNRDEIEQDDRVGVRIDPYNDSKLAYQFFVNPRGIQLDSIDNALQLGESTDWDGIWQSAAKITDSGYQVELAIPLRNFNFNRSEQAQTWAIEFLRFHPRNVTRRLSHIPLDRNNLCVLCQMMPVTGFANAKQAQSLSLVPTLVVARSEDRFLPFESDYSTSDDIEPSLDIKWGITPSTSLNATLNPDFSQVEADAAQLGINNNFTLFFPERRPFFVENQDIFDTTYDLVYTRNIGNPDYGLKLTGRSGKHAYGVFVANDTETTFLVSGNVSSSIAVLDQESENGAFRYRYDVNNKLSLGWLGTYRTSEGYRNQVNSVDLSYRFSDQDAIDVQAVYSDTRYPDFLSDLFCEGDTCEQDDIQCSFANCIVNEQVLRTRSGAGGLSDVALAVNYEHSERNWNVFVDYFQIGSDFRSDLGFRTRVDVTQLSGGAALIAIPEEKTWWKRFEHGVEWSFQENEAGDRLANLVGYYLNVEGPLQSTGTLQCDFGKQVGNRLDETTLAIAGNTDTFNRNECFLLGQVQPSKNLALGVGVTAGNDVDLANNRPGDRLVITPSVEYSFNKYLRVEADYAFDQLEADDERVFTARQLDLRVNYNLDVRNFIRLSVIYTDIDINLDNNPALVFEGLPDSRSRSISTQLLYQYEVNPQTVFFIGYSDNAIETDDVRSFTRDTRSVFVKFSYAFLL